MSNSKDTDDLSQAAAALLQDPVQLRKFSERVLELMQEDLRNQRDRTGYPPRSYR